MELDCLHTQGFGRVKQIGKSLHFFKPHPVSVAINNEILLSSHVTHDEYTARFLNVSTMTPRMKTICLNHHHHAELLYDILTQQTQDGDDYY